MQDLNQTNHYVPTKHVAVIVINLPRLQLVRNVCSSLYQIPILRCMNSMYYIVLLVSLSLKCLVLSPLFQPEIYQHYIIIIKEYKLYHRLFISLISKKPAERQTMQMWRSQQSLIYKRRDVRTFSHV